MCQIFQDPWTIIRGNLEKCPICNLEESPESAPQIQVRAKYVPGSSLTRTRQGWKHNLHIFSSGVITYSELTFYYWCCCVTASTTVEGIMWRWISHMWPFNTWCKHWLYCTLAWHSGEVSNCFMWSRKMPVVVSVADTAESVPVQRERRRWIKDAEAQPGALYY